MSYVRSNNPSLKYQRATPFGRQDKGIRKFKFVAKTCFFIKIFFKEKIFQTINPVISNSLCLKYERSTP